MLPLSLCEPAARNEVKSRGRRGRGNSDVLDTEAGGEEEAVRVAAPFVGVLPPPPDGDLPAPKGPAPKLLVAPSTVGDGKRLAAGGLVRPSPWP